MITESIFGMMALLVTGFRVLATITNVEVSVDIVMVIVAVVKF
jgi:hypothetical protein